MVNSEGQAPHHAPLGSDERPLAATPKPLNMQDIAAGQKLMAWSMLAWVIGFFPPAIFVTIPFQLYGVFKLTRALKMWGPMTVLLMLAVLVPIFCVLVFVGLYLKAGRVLRSQPNEPS